MRLTSLHRLLALAAALAICLLPTLSAHATQPVIKGGDSITVVLGEAITTTNPTWSIDYVRNCTWSYTRDTVRICTPCRSAPRPRANLHPDPVQICT